MDRAGLLLTFALAGCFGAGEDVPPPRLAAIQPDRGVPGLAVELFGEHFCQNPTHDDDEPPPCTPGDAQIYFDTTTVVTSIVDDGSAIGTVPALPPGRAEVYL